MKKIDWWLVALTVVIVLGIGVALYFWLADRQPSEPEAPPPAVEAPAEEPPPPEPRYVVPEPEPEPEPPPPLPELGRESDAAIRAELESLAGEEAVEEHLTESDVIRRLVVTIDNLPRKQLALRLRAVPPVDGNFVVEDARGRMVLSPENYERYDPLVAMLTAVDAEELTALYSRYYPLFQQTYEDLGYPSGYFNDRLVGVIDHLLETPEVDGPIELVRPHVLYEFADPSLEERSVGQKLLIRMGAENAARIKEKLRELREALVASAAAAATAAGAEEGAAADAGEAPEEPTVEDSAGRP